VLINKNIVRQFGVKYYICNIVAQKMYSVKFVYVNCPEGHVVWWCTISSQIIVGIFESHIISLSVAVLHAIDTFICP